MAKFKQGQTGYIAGLLGPTQGIFIAERKNLYIISVNTVLGGSYYSEYKKTDVFPTKSGASKKSTF